MKTIFIVLMCLLSNGIMAQSYPDYKGVVNDFEEVLTNKQEKSITKIINRTESKTNSKILVVSTKDFKPAKDYKSYIYGLFNHWKLSETKTANWVLVLFSYQNKELKIIPGKDIKLLLTADTIRTIIEDIMAPKFLDNKYYVGLKKGLKSLAKTIKSFKTQK